MKRWLARNERTAISCLVLGLFVLVYFGTAALTPWRPRAILRWDPVWSVPYVPQFLLPYLSVFVMPLVAIRVVDGAPAFRRVATAFALAILMSGICFLAFPLLPPHPPSMGDGLWARLLLIEYGIDVPTNLFPSLHVSVAYLCALAVGRARPSWRVGMLLWATLVAASTLFVRQHYALDVLGGMLVAALAWRAAAPRRP